MISFSKLKLDFKITPNCSENIHVALQATGLSGLRPNTYCLNFPTVMAGRSYDFFYSVLRHATAAKCSLLVTKGIDKFPAPEEKKTWNLKNLKNLGQQSGIQGTVDVWWIRQDGGWFLTFWIFGLFDFQRKVKNLPDC